jgi:hypothetical protein
MKDTINILNRVAAKWDSKYHGTSKEESKPPATIVIVYEI